MEDEYAESIIQAIRDCGNEVKQLRASIMELTRVLESKTDADNREYIATKLASFIAREAVR